MPRNISVVIAIKETSASSVVNVVHTQRLSPKGCYSTQSAVISSREISYYLLFLLGIVHQIVDGSSMDDAARSQVPMSAAYDDFELFMRVAEMGRRCRDGSPFLIQRLP